MATRIDRTLVLRDRGGARRQIRQDDILRFNQPVVILGDPGMGKSVLARTLGECPGMTCISAGTFVRRADAASLASEGGRIVVDGLDEVASSVPGGAVDRVLTKLSAIHNPLFILTCRQADWLGAADRVEIERDYGQDLLVLYLQPFTRDDACEFLSQKFPEVDADQILNHVANRGLEDIYRNPLTLRMLGDTAREAGDLPDSRAELFKRACKLMLREESELQQNKPHAHRRQDELLLAAGAICATQLLCDREGVYTGPYMKTPDGFANVADIQKLRLGEPARDALKFRLFPGEGEQRFTHIHRVIAEYLGARWLARCVEEGVSERRILGLLRHGGGVPTSLRGLHAWIPHFSQALARTCIAADPYAVLRYGDAETLDLEEARALLDALTRLSEADPYFRSEDWGRHRVTGLMRPELKRQIVGIIRGPGSHMQLRTLLLEAVVGTELAAELIEDLEVIMFDHDRSYEEREAAADAIRLASEGDDWEAIVTRLLKSGDEDSARLACELVDDVGAPSVSVSTCVETVFAHLGLSVSRYPRWDEDTIWNVRSSQFDGLETEQLCVLLDEIGDYARMLSDVPDQGERAMLVIPVLRKAADVLEARAGIDPERVWTWLGWLESGMVGSGEGRDRLAAVFRTNRRLRAAILEHVLLTSCTGNAFAAGHRLIGMGLDLHPRDEDFAALFRALKVRAGDGRMDPDVWRSLLYLAQSTDGVPRTVHQAAKKEAAEDPELLAVLEHVDKIVQAPWQEEKAERKAIAEEEGRVHLEARRAALAEKMNDVAAGDFRALDEPASVYIGKPGGFDRDRSPEERIREFLGDTLGEQVLCGFIAVLGRDDLPTAAEFASSRCRNRRLRVELPMICGVAEMLRRGISIDKVDRGILAAVYMALQRAPVSRLAETVDLNAALEPVLFGNEADWEAHFRASIEPQLALNIVDPAELYRLVREPQFANLGGRLSVEWLAAYPGLSPRTQKTLLDCALKNASGDCVKTLLVERRTKDACDDDETRRLWLSADVLIDLDNCRDALLAAAAEDKGLLWALKDRIGSERQEAGTRLSLQQLTFIVEALGIGWEELDWPGGTVVGSEHPYDASKFIKRAIILIGKDPSAAASEALNRLIEENHAPTYVNTMRHVLAMQRKARRDHEYIAPTLSQLGAVVADGLPESVDDMRAYFADRIDTVQQRMQGSNTDMWQAYWSDEEPRGENYCRNRLVEHILGQLPPSVRFEVERHMPERKRADIAVIRNTIVLPVEIKGQWHPEVWDAACEQLDAKYTQDWQAEGRGVFIVLWFGELTEKNLPGHPKRLPRPKTPEEMKKMLLDRIPEARRSDLDVHVIDVSRPETRC